LESYEIKKIDVFSVFKITLVLGIVIGLIVGVIFIAVFGAALSSLRGIMGGRFLPIGAALSVVGVIIYAIIYGIVSAIISAIAAFLYNVVAGFIGGVKIDLEKAAAVAAITPVTPAPAAPAAPAVRYCPKCGSPMRYIAQYKRWWCDTCRQYR